MNTSNIFNKKITPKKLRLGLLIFFIALITPTIILVRQAYTQLQWEAFHQYQTLAEELSNRVDQRLINLMATEEARTFTDYQFLVASGDANNNYLQPSDLSQYPIKSDIAGLLGHFQVDAQGRFTTPLLPSIASEANRYGISSKQIEERQQLQQKIFQILNENSLLAKQKTKEKKIDAITNLEETTENILEEEISDPKTPSSIAPDIENRAIENQVLAQDAFDDIKQNFAGRVRSLGKITDLKLESSAAYKENIGDIASTETLSRKTRKEIDIVSSSIESTKNNYEKTLKTKDTITTKPVLNMFENEVGPFQFSVLNEEYFLIYRNVWYNGQRYIQGALIAQQDFAEQLISQDFYATTLSQMSDIIIAYQGEVLSTLSGMLHSSYNSTTADITGTLLYQRRLSAPLNQLTLIFSINRLPAGAGWYVILWATGIFVLILLIGCYLLYKTIMRQLKLTQQQQDFVSAVSHELKTPLTSIRMYGEMLRANWVDEEKKKSYYDFIFFESERLSRLINNVLQLARMTHTTPALDLKYVSVSEILDTIRSKIETQVDNAEFILEFHAEDITKTSQIAINIDSFIQIIINLVDNAIKFSAKSTLKKIDIRAELTGKYNITISVRDYGPGIAKNQLKKIFQLFYRTENELTRETVGTGIGLALVHQLTHAMGGQIDVVNTDPGTEFRLLFPIADPKKQPET